MDETRAQVEALLEALPDVDRPGREDKFTGPRWDAVLGLVEKLLAGGRESVATLAGLVEDGFGGGPKGFRAGYLLHAALLAVAVPERAAERKLIVEAVASRLEGTVPRNAQAFLVRELLLAAGDEAVAPLSKLLGDDALCAPAAQALEAIGAGARDGRAAEALRGAWPKASGARRAAIAQALGALGDAPAGALLRDGLGDADAAVRMACAWALARIGDSEAGGAIMALADGATGWERTKATQACLIFAETLAARGRREDARRVYMHLSESRKDAGEAHVREAAARGLKALAG